MNFLNYNLPKHKIAQRPVAGRSTSKLLYAKGSQITDLIFSDLPSILKPGDLLLLNNSKVSPRRFFINHNNREIEVLLEKEDAPGIWHAFAKPMKKLKEKDRFALCENVDAEVLGRTDDGFKIVLKLEADGDLRAALDQAGNMPIPPYIRAGKADLEDKTTYQTIYADNPGSIAAPTAGLHFTTELLSELKNIGVNHSFITLHVGSASFQPVRSDNYSDHQMPEEFFTVADETISKIEGCKKNGGRVIGVGTTTTRAIESYYLDQTVHSKDANGRFMNRPYSSTKLYINPGFEFQCIDILITNFHQPLTTHLLMVAAFIGERRTEEIYKHALENNYRFLSYGDAMILER